MSQSPCLVASVPDAVVAGLAGVVVAFEEVAIGAGGIYTFVAAELALIFVAGTVGGGAGLLQKSSSTDTNSWSEQVRTLALGSCTRAGAGEFFSFFSSMTAAVATAARAARMRVANWEKRCEYFAEQRTCQFNGQTFIISVLWC